MSSWDDIDVFLGSDHSQLEIRVLAQLSGDPLLIELLNSGEDIHSAVGHELTGIPIEKIKDDRETRTIIKGIHFGIIYGLTAESLFLTLQVDAARKGEKFTMTREQVTTLYNKYFTKFKIVKEWLEEQVAFAEEFNYVETLFGFRREILPFGDDERATFWVNQAKNSGIQGTAHQLLLICLAILEIKKKTYHLMQRLSMEVHDSLWVYSSVKNLPETYQQAKRLLEEEVLVYIKKWWPDVEWKVPLKSESKAGFRLGTTIKYHGEPADEFVDKWCRHNMKSEMGMYKQMIESRKSNLVS